MTFLINLIKAAVLNGTPLLFGTSGEILTEKSGNLNLGVEGLMFMGGAFGFAASFYYDQLTGGNGSTVMVMIVAILASFIAGCLGSLIFSFITITLRSNQNVTGLALTIFGTGVGQFIGELLRIRVGGNVSISNHLKEAFTDPFLPEFMGDIPILGDLLFKYNFIVYFGFIMALIMAFVIKKTRLGLQLRAVGESPATADAAGINVIKYRYLATIIGGGISAIGGMVYIMTIAGSVWSHEGLSGVGWISVALVIFCLWKPGNALWGSVLFGGLMILFLRLPIPFIPTQIYKVVPYIATAVVLIMVSMRQRREDQPPLGLGLNYFREER